MQTLAQVVQEVRERGTFSPIAICVGKPALTEYEKKFLGEHFDSFVENEFDYGWSSRAGSSKSRLPGVFGKIFRLLNLYSALRSIRKKYRELLSASDVATVVTLNDKSSPSHDLIELAHRAGIPVVLVQSTIPKGLGFNMEVSMVARLSRWLIGWQTGTILHGQGGCDIYAAWGESSREYYKAVGVEPSAIVVTGSPRMDLIAEELAETDRNLSRRRLGLAPDADCVLFTTNPLDTLTISTQADYAMAMRQVIERAIEVGDQDPGFRMVVKPHPWEIEVHRVLGIRELCDRSDSILYVEDATIVDCLVASDRIVSLPSTVVLEATLAEKPCVIFNPSGWNYGVEYTKSGVATELTSIDELTRFLEAAKKYEDDDSISHFIFDKGNGAKSVADLILKTAASRGA
jgi:hypothetical protein